MCSSVIASNQFFARLCVAWSIRRAHRRFGTPVRIALQLGVPAGVPVAAIFRQPFFLHTERQRFDNLSTVQTIWQRFSNHLFWDVDPVELSLDRHRKYIVQRVLGHGQIQDWRLLVECYGVEEIVTTAQTLRSLDPKTLAFIACVGHVNRDSFRCYSQTPSSRQQWIS